MPVQSPQNRILPVCKHSFTHIHTPADARKHGARRHTQAHAFQLLQDKWCGRRLSQSQRISGMRADISLGDVIYQLVVLFVLNEMKSLSLLQILIRCTVAAELDPPQDHTLQPGPLNWAQLCLHSNCTIKWGGSVTYTQLDAFVRGRPWIKEG